MNDKHLKPLYAAVLRLLRPLIRILLRNGVSFGTFSDFAKWVYVDVASEEFGIRGRKQSVSRVSVITGLSRKEVTRVRQLPRPDDRTSSERYNRAARVIAAWRRDSNFQDVDGKPAQGLFHPAIGDVRPGTRVVETESHSRFFNHLLRLSSSRIVVWFSAVPVNYSELFAIVYIFRPQVQVRLP